MELKLSAKYGKIITTIIVFSIIIILVAPITIGGVPSNIKLFFLALTALMLIGVLIVGLGVIIIDILKFLNKDKPLDKSLIICMPLLIIVLYFTLASPMQCSSQLTPVFVDLSVRGTEYGYIDTEVMVGDLLSMCSLKGHKIIFSVYDNEQVIAEKRIEITSEYVSGITKKHQTKIQITPEYHNKPLYVKVDLEGNFIIRPKGLQSDIIKVSYRS